MRLTPSEAAARVDRLAARLTSFEKLAESCRMCGHACGADRLRGQTGRCRTTSTGADSLRVAAHTLHFGEEPPIAGQYGSGTVFFSHCNLRCVFCQNYQISQEGLGEEIRWQALVEIFLELQGRGAENINLVTPTHYMLPIARALHQAYAGGLRLPLVYNTNGFDSVELLSLLDGVVDIYLPDIKYMDPTCAERYSQAEGYPDVAQAALRAMRAQVGGLDLEVSSARGMIVRHLVLPNNLSQSYEVLLWLANEGMLDAPLSLMSQYAPHHRAVGLPELDGRIAAEEYAALIEYAQSLGFEHVFVQEMESQEIYAPDFRSDNPFNAPRATGGSATEK